MWADTLFRAEQQHLLQLLVWAAVSVMLATATAATMALRRMRSPLLSHFAWQTAAWGVAIGIAAAAGWPRTQMRDLAGAARLERLLWLRMGLDLGLVGIGIVLSIVGWRLARTMALVGTGIASAIQGLALFVMDLQLAVIVSR